MTATLAVIFLFLTAIQGVYLAIKGNPSKNIVNTTIVISVVLMIIFMVISIMQKS